VAQAGPSIPVQVLGLSGVPECGRRLRGRGRRALAKDVAQQRDAKRRETRLVAAAGNRMEDIMAQMGQGAGAADPQPGGQGRRAGFGEALREALTGLSNEQIRINVIGSGVGGITESDASWRPPPRPPSSASTCVPTPPRVASSKATASTCATSRSSTT
jgi:translation initiation factor IF-2